MSLCPSPSRRMASVPARALPVLFLSVLLLAALIAGCNPFTTAYKVAVDPREASVQAKDKEIANTVLARFASEFGTGVLDIEPYAYAGRVYLVGQYEKAERKDRAVELARSVDGVKNVKTYVMLKRDVAGCSAAQNFALAKEIGTRLLADPDVPGTNIDVATVQCTAVLLGLVSTQDEAARAIEITKKVSGVRKVTSFVRPYRPGS